MRGLHDTQDPSGKFQTLLEADCSRNYTALALWPLLSMHQICGSLGGSYASSQGHIVSG